MALQAKVESLENLAESLHEYYTEKDGVYVLDVAGIEDHTADLKKERDARRKLERELGKFKEVDLTKYNEMKDRLEELEDKLKPDADDKREMNKIEKILKAHQAEIEAMKAEKQRYAEEMIRDKKKTVILSACQEAGLTKTKGIFPHVAERVKVSNDNGKIEIDVIGTDGETEYKTDGSKKTVADLLEEMRFDEEFKPFFPANTGGGAQGSTRGATGRRTQIDDKLPPAERINQWRIQQGKT